MPYCAMRYEHALKQWHERRERIRELAQSGIPQSEIAKRFNLSRARISQIVANGNGPKK